MTVTDILAEFDRRAAPGAGFYEPEEPAQIIRAMLTAKPQPKGTESQITAALKIAISQACVSPDFLKGVEKDIAAALASKYRGAFEGVITDAAALIPHPLHPNMNNSWHGRFAGIDIHVRPDHPRRQLPEDVPCTPAYRVEFNAWLAEFFGMENLIKDGEVIHVGPRIFVNPRTYQALRQQPGFQPFDPLALASPRFWQIDPYSR